MTDATRQSVLDRLLDLLDRPIAFQRPFVELTGSLVAGLMLSQAFHWTRVMCRKYGDEWDGWFYKVQEEWTEETGMSRSEQETARKHLRRTGFWQETRRGIPAKLYFRLDLDRLVDALLNQPPKAQKRLKNPQQNHQNATFQQTSLPQDSKQARDNAADQLPTFSQPITETTAGTTLSENTPEREINVRNVGNKRAKGQKPIGLSEREEALAQEIARHLDGDDHSLGAFRRIVSNQCGLGEDIALRLMMETFELDEARKIKTSRGAYFIDASQREARRQGIELGFTSMKTYGLAQES